MHSRSSVKAPLTHALQEIGKLYQAMDRQEYRMSFLSIGDIRDCLIGPIEGDCKRTPVAALKNDRIFSGNLSQFQDFEFLIMEWVERMSDGRPSRIPLVRQCI